MSGRNPPKFVTLSNTVTVPNHRIFRVGKVRAPLLGMSNSPWGESARDCRMFLRMRGFVPCRKSLCRKSSEVQSLVCDCVERLRERREESPLTTKNMLIGPGFECVTKRWSPRHVSRTSVLKDWVRRCGSPAVSSECPGPGLPSSFLLSPPSGSLLPASHLLGSPQPGSLSKSSQLPHPLPLGPP